jgi:hypothetical protein
MLLKQAKTVVATLNAEVRKRDVPHTEVLVRHGALRAQIDEKIAPLVLETWKADVETVSSCQDSFDGPSHWFLGTIQLTFASLADAQKWLRIVVTQTGKDALGYPTEAKKSKSDRLGWRWHWTADPYNAAYQRKRGEVVGAPVLDCMVHVFFPSKDLSKVIERLKAHNGVVPQTGTSAALTPTSRLPENVAQAVPNGPDAGLGPTLGRRIMARGPIPEEIAASARETAAIVVATATGHIQILLPPLPAPPSNESRLAMAFV